MAFKPQLLPATPVDMVLNFSAAALSKSNVYDYQEYLQGGSNIKFRKIVPYEEIGKEVQVINEGLALKFDSNLRLECVSGPKFIRGRWQQIVNAVVCER